MPSIGITGRVLGQSSIRVASTLDPAIKAAVPVRVEGANLYTPQLPFTSKGVTFSRNTDGSIHVAGTGTINWVALPISLKLAEGDYKATLSRKTGSSLTSKVSTDDQTNLWIFEEGEQTRHLTAGVYNILILTGDAGQTYDEDVTLDVHQIN
ncbi:hypothetical protein [Bifidobacterium callitrichos]|uniref:Uncharacterized protein n=1 Tax=Bifidobacterium callitrichos DSM 23973 TaxID=1437609 RepID=A0A087ACU0_9BIFI|nr:hypothetical protein [Bifidobacterium callitrichos]KFI56590.1 hypothetical protein BCAL_0188 [Bifidobacterium callitrichos DSM 23973]